MGEIVSKFVGIAVIIILLTVILALPTMLLWNWLMPVIFGLKTITFGQAVGLVYLCGFLFKSSSSSK